MTRIETTELKHTCILKRNEKTSMVKKENFKNKANFINTFYHGNLDSIDFRTYFLDSLGSSHSYLY